MRKQTLLSMTDAAETIRQSASIRQIVDYVESTVKGLGFDLYCYYQFGCELVDVALVLLTNCKPDFFMRYDSEGFIHHDPVAHQSARERTPFLWQPLRALTTSPVQRRVVDHSIAAGFSSGATIPLLGPLQSRSVFSVGSDMQTGDFEKLFKSVNQELLLLSAIAHERILWLQANKRDADDVFATSLTKREIEVLCWAAKGKTEADIADILSISRYTVAQHIASCRQKLNALNKTHAVVKALQHDLISIH